MIEFGILTESARLRISTLEDRHDVTSNKRSSGRAARFGEFIHNRYRVYKRALIRVVSDLLRGTLSDSLQ